MSAWQTPVSWSSCKMKAVAASSCEAEYMAASEIVRECLWLRYLFSDLGYGDLSCQNFGTLCEEDFVKVQLSELVDKNEKPITCFGDNKGAIAISYNPVLHKRTKHIHVRYHLTRHEVDKGHVVFGYINTKENLADLMTKGLTRVPHNHLVGKIMFSVEDGQVTDIEGQDVVWEARAPVLTELYQSKPRGLYPEWKNIETPWIHRQSRWADTMPEFSMPPIPQGGIAVKKNEDLGQLELALERANQDMKTEEDEELLAWTTCHCLFTLVISGNITLGSQANSTLNALSTHLDAFCDIVDSGASFTFVGGHCNLKNAKEATGVVHVADGRAKQIEEIGDYGPMKNARKVSCFKRTLVSVTDLVQQFGSVLFDDDGVHVTSTREDGTEVKTQIGRPTPQRLYSFEVGSLKDHVQRLRRRFTSWKRPGRVRRSRRHR